ncbi:tRNA methyltransferas-like protein [Periconia macrospinosa]|uniref:tRNA methyltransferas-like protein n=1 Tax=Periconia macrospinosa TaxID=97972 RepID=A0A2V1DZH5_9PLEO|nr:tRNA methyltransferas-like protein [Periconia macrospinosa]
MMAFPYQCLTALTRPGASSEDWAVFGATGSTLVVQSSNGTKSVWPTAQEAEKETEQADVSQEPSGKRIKLSHPVRQKNNFSILKTSNNGNYLIAVTAEDKCIRVFQIASDWRLQQLSERCMMRRPCSIALSADDLTILCADKFGDVYALPLIPSPEDERSVSPQTAEEPRKFVPSASLSTVHSGRNRKVLEEQLKQAEKGRPQPKDAPTFKHDLLLGHVSMLTDIASVTVGSRSYIITADRDEHIRVSRGIPQAHIIEGFCQGHEEFVNRLCITKSNRLVSGGGDTHLYIWDWLSYRLLERLPLQTTVLDIFRNNLDMKSLLPEKDEDLRIAVSGIWNVPSVEHDVDEIVVACEGVPALVKFKLGELSEVAQVLPLRGNALDIAFITAAGTRTAVVSIDHVHKPGSITEMREDQQETSRLQFFSMGQDGKWVEDEKLEPTLEWFSRYAEGAGGPDTDTGDLAREKCGKEVQNVVYGVENLRKRPGAEAEAEVAVPGE